MSGRLVAVVVLVGIAALVAVAVLRPPEEPAAAPDIDAQRELPVEDVTGTGATAPTDDAPASTVTSTTLAQPVLEDSVALTGLAGWLQSDIGSLAELEGQVAIVQFWTFGCHNCKATLPHLQDIYAAYGPGGLEIVGVHAPEFEYEKDVDAIASAARDLGVTWPIALDTDRVNFWEWQGSPAYWPRTYVLDRQGRVRFDHIGEGKYEELEATVGALLAET